MILWIGFNVVLHRIPEYLCATSQSSIRHTYIYYYTKRVRKEIRPNHCYSEHQMWILHMLTVSFPVVSTCSIGYPVVYLGFYATCYFTNIFKLRIQKAVQNENDFNMHLLQRSLPPGLQVYPKTVTDGSSESLVPSNTTHKFFSFHFVPLATEYSWVSSA